MDRNTDTAGLCLSVFGAGVLAGIALGLTAGVLLAPRTGRESRESVRRSVDKAVKKGRTYVERVRVQDGDGAEEATEE
jgi:gas vesicle protein